VTPFIPGDPLADPPVPDIPATYRTGDDRRQHLRIRRFCTNRLSQLWRRGTQHRPREQTHQRHDSHMATEEPTQQRQPVCRREQHRVDRHYVIQPDRLLRDSGQLYRSAERGRRLGLFQRVGHRRRLLPESYRSVHGRDVPGFGSVVAVCPRVRHLTVAVSEKPRVRQEQLRRRAQRIAAPPGHDNGAGLDLCGRGVVDQGAVHG
jgi:hypothetical protein